MQYNVLSAHIWPIKTKKSYLASITISLIIVRNVTSDIERRNRRCLFEPEKRRAESSTRACARDILQQRDYETEKDAGHKRKGGKKIRVL